MSDRVHVLAQQLLGKTSVEACDLQAVKDLAQRYPYFAPAQFLLLEKLKQENSPEYHAQLQKAVLYYHNPLEFELFINSGRFYTEPDLEEEVTAPEEAGRQEPVVTEQGSSLVSMVPDESEAPVIEVANLPEEKYEDIEIAEEISEATAPATGIASTTGPPAPEPPPASDQAPAVSGNADNSTQELAFEPYHTVDYFASQGIRLSQEEASKDKFGRQLKSFTEWLRTMKRLPATTPANEVDPTTEKKVQHLAEDSIHESDVVTEAMAEVWLKQGNREKAIETYNKLGLLNPSKKPYFAALIENLKRS